MLIKILLTYKNIYLIIISEILTLANLLDIVNDLQIFHHY